MLTLLRRFTLLYLPLALGLSIVLVLLARFDEHTRVAQLASSEARHVGVARERTEKDFESAEGDIRIIVEMDELRQYVDSGDALHRQGMEEFFLLLSRGRQHYSQIRYLDASGQEVIRVDYIDGMPVAVPHDELQNKSQHEYFSDTMQLARNEIYVSPLDLNIEHGLVEIPYRPVIRFATPVFDSAGRRQGVVVLNYIADEMLQHFRLAMQGSESVGGMLLNREGFWLSSPNREDEWGFMLDRPERTFGHAYPEAWRTISKADVGTLRTEQGLFASVTARPLLIDEHAFMGSVVQGVSDGKKQSAAGYHWKVVSFVPQSVISSGAFYHRTSGQILTIAAYLLLALAVFIIVLVVSRHKKAEQALKEMALLPEMAPGPVMRVDRDGTVCLANTASNDLYGMDKVEGMSIFKAIPGLAGEEFAEMFGPDEKIMQVETKLGAAHYFFVLRSEPLRKYVFVYGADISPIKLLEDQVRQAQKMEVVGQLAGGIAHDFNTLLGVILGYSEMLRDGLPEGGVSRQNVDAILQAGKRAKSLVKQLMDFSRLGTSKQEPVQLALLLKETIRLLRHSLPEKLTVQQDIQVNTGEIQANATQIGQVIMNLCMNAAGPMDDGEGLLQVSLKESRVDDRMATVQHVQPGSFLQLSIADNGCGMDSEIMQHLFEPFFTTKGVGKRTGLGLAVVHGIVKGHGGFVFVESEPGKGSSFHVYLPKSRGAKS